MLRCYIDNDLWNSACIEIVSMKKPQNHLWNTCLRDFVFQKCVNFPREEQAAECESWCVQGTYDKEKKQCQCQQGWYGDCCQIQISKFVALLKITFVALLQT